MKSFFFLFTLSLPILAHTESEFAKGSLTHTTVAEVAKPEDAPPLVRINATVQSFNAGQPWQRNNPSTQRGTGILIAPDEILTVAELVADQTFLEFESPDGSKSVSARVEAIDYKSNLAILKPAKGVDLGFLKDLKPIELGSPAAIGDEVIVWQLEYTGRPVKTVGTVRGVDAIATFLPGYSFLTYEVKGSMQSASSSFTLPVVKDDKLLGLLTTYDSEDLLSTVIAPEVIGAFLKDAREGGYEGFPSLGISSQSTEDDSFRAFLKLSEDVGGLYVARVKKGSAAEKAGLQKGDVLTRMEGYEIDRRGYFEHPMYGLLPWTVLMRSDKAVGDQVQLTYLREGQLQETTATLSKAEEPLVPRHIHDSAPPFLVKGGLVFQELSRSYLEAFGENWSTRAPLKLMHMYNNEEDYAEGRKRIVFLARIIPNPATIGYDEVNSLLVTSANGKAVEDLKSLADALSQVPENGIHTLELSDSPHTLYLDAKLADIVDEQLLQSGLPMLSRMSTE